jgi:hypothetical protein
MTSQCTVFPATPPIPPARRQSTRNVLLSPAQPMGRRGTRTKRIRTDRIGDDPPPPCPSASPSDSWVVSLTRLEPISDSSRRCGQKKTRTEPGLGKPGLGIVRHITVWECRNHIAWLLRTHRLHSDRRGEGARCSRAMRILEGVTHRPTRPTGWPEGVGQSLLPRVSASRQGILSLR